MSDATRKTPLETARAFCGTNPDALPPGKYKVVSDLHDRGTDRLLAAIAAAPDRDMTLAEAEAAMYEHTRYFTIRLERAWETNDRPRSTKWSVCAPRGAGCEFRIFEYESLRRAVDAAIEYIRPAKLPTAHEVSAQIDGLEQPEPFDPDTGPMVAIPPSTRCRGCANPHCQDCCDASNEAADREPIGDDKDGEE